MENLISLSSTERISACLKSLTIEEPLSRLAQVRKQVLRKMPQIKEKASSYSPLYFARLYGAMHCGKADRAMVLANIVLALLDLRIYKDSAFNLLVIEPLSLKDYDEPELASFFSLTERLLDLLKPQAAPSLRRKMLAWLQFRLLACPNWREFCLPPSEPMQESLIESLIQPINDLLGACENELSARDLTASASLPGFADSLLQLTKNLSPRLAPRLILLVEGNSEFIFLPGAAEKLGFRLDDLGVSLISSGGARQVVKRFLLLRELVSLPVVALLDEDAVEEIGIIEESLRDIDHLKVVEGGELEDCFSYEFLLYALNEQLQLHGQVLSQMPFFMPREGARKAYLAKLFRERGLGDFDKLEFAQVARRSLRSSADVPVFVQDFLLFLKGLSEIERTE
ncbi:MAG: ATP-dependent endonuclease [Candidatus Obscuribacterales bacterium]|nr:ATP-dependent endonuclease [Candidatus Obscuribacterales bacterium]